jgi:hypothetical protein
MKGSYISSGKWWGNKGGSVPAKGNAVYTLVKSSGSATGSCGMVQFAVQNTNYEISVLFENPWSDWPFIVTCAGTSVPIANGDSYDDLYDKTYDLAKADGKQATVRAFTDNRCIYIEDIYAKQKNLSASQKKIFGSY